MNGERKSSYTVATQFPVKKQNKTPWRNTVESLLNGQT